MRISREDGKGPASVNEPLYVNFQKARSQRLEDVDRTRAALMLTRAAPVDIRLECFYLHTIGVEMVDRKDVPQGTLDLMILRVLAQAPLHGWGLMQRLRLLTDEVFQVTPGSLFPALQRLEDSRCLTGKWDTSENNRRARYYSITKAGRKRLAEEESHWNAIAAAVAKVLEKTS